MIPGRNDDRRHAPLWNLRPKEAQVLRLEGVVVGADVLALLGLGLPRQGGVVDLEVVGALQDAEVRGDEVPGIDLNNVPGDEELGVLVHLDPVPEDEHLGGEHVREALHQVRGLLVLQEAEDPGDENDESKHGAEVQVVGLVLEVVSDEAQHRAEPQKQREEPGQLLHEHDAHGSFLGRGEHVCSPFILQGLDLGGGQPGLEGGSQAGLEVPKGLLVLRQNHILLQLVLTLLLGRFLFGRVGHDPKGFGLMMGLLRSLSLVKGKLGKLIIKKRGRGWCGVSREGEGRGRGDSTRSIEWKGFVTLIMSANLLTFILK